MIGTTVRKELGATSVPNLSHKTSDDVFGSNENVRRDQIFFLM